MLDVDQPFLKLKGYIRQNVWIQTSYKTWLDKHLPEMWEMDSLGVISPDDNQLNQEEILATSNVEKSR